MKKKKLLITMGCSLTEGVGCYNMDNFPIEYKDKFKGRGRADINDIGDFFDSDVGTLFYDSSKDRFHELGWPVQLGKKLGYDKIINLGLGASSTSGQVKQFFEKYLDKDLTNWDVLIIWLLPDASRMSFYFHRTINNLLPAMSSDVDMSLESEYIKKIGNVVTDTVLEQIFYIKVMEQVCQSKGYSILISHNNGEDNEELYLRYKSKNYLSPTSNINVMDWSGYNGDDVICFEGHPNELGYSIMAQNMYELIKEYHPHYITQPSKDEIEWEWDGNPLLHNPREDFND
jgi:hypothetical protein